ncbi:hypothetical protein [Methanothrix soehngenii]|jgi:hypothetical protein|uniref:hypothetical protein n=1 Tax=Methanothrix soehngenii TaxID=2223 RepID=UPI002357CE83|nr:hypothetical protein [Methanothrix soehngenii]
MEIRRRRNKSNLIQPPKSDHKALPLVLKDAQERRAFLRTLELWRLFDSYLAALLEIGGTSEQN